MLLLDADRTYGTDLTSCVADRLVVEVQESIRGFDGEAERITRRENWFPTEVYQASRKYCSRCAIRGSCRLDSHSQFDLHLETGSVVHCKQGVCRF